MNSARITLINVIEAPAESIEQFISDWKADKDFMISQPGFIDGAFYCSLQSDPRFRFVNVAHWKSGDDWKAAIEAREKHGAGKGIDRLSGLPNGNRVIDHLFALMAVRPKRRVRFSGFRPGTDYLAQVA
jgi:heme oxygenase (mycobilin-producing)